MADPHAGFAAAVGIGRRALEDLAKALYFAGRFDHHLTATVPGLLSDASVGFEDVYLTAPTFELERANQGRVGLRLHGWGPVRVTPNDAQRPPELRDCEIDLLVLLRPRAVLVRGRLGIVFDTSTATVQNVSVRPFLGSSFSAAAQAYLDSPGFRTLVEFGLRVELARRGALIPPFDVSFLGAVATDPSTTAKLAVVDDALVLGLDVSTTEVTTNGDASRLTNFLGDRDIGMWTNPASAPVAFGAIKSQLEALVASEGATLQAFSLAVEEGGFRITGTAGKDVGSVTFSLLASPVLDKGPNPGEDQLRFRIDEEKVDVKPAWWVVLLEVVTVGIVAAIVELLATMIRSNIVNGIRITPAKGVAPLTIRFTLPDVPEPTITLRIVAFECHTEGIFAGLTLDAGFHKPKIVGPDVVAAEEVPSFARQPLVYRADLAFESLQDDPTLRARWTVRVPGGASPLLVQDRRVFDGGAFLVVNESVVPLLSAPTFRFECRVYRVLGSQSDDLLDDVVTLQVTDRLSRAQPYVRWMHQALVPIVRVEADGSRSILGEAIKTRRSKIHRTAIPGRCRMASHYSQTWFLSKPGAPGATLEYLPALPFPVADLVAHRAQVCDYCFFGGPTRNQPLVL